MPKSVSLKILGLKLNCIITWLDLDTIQKARNELNEARGLQVSFTLSHLQNWNDVLTDMTQSRRLIDF